MTNPRARAAAPMSRSPNEEIPFTVETGRGQRWTYGSGLPRFVVRVPDRSTWQRLVSQGAYDLAAAFVAGRFDIEGDLLAAFRWWNQHKHQSVLPFPTARVSLESWWQSRRRARRDIEFHYDRSNEFYRQFLDRKMVYSCAYFANASMSLDEAQSAKLRYVSCKLDLHAGDRFLDIGCGWGALVLEAAGEFGTTAVGCTLSRQQFDYASQAVRASGLNSRARIELRDYRAIQGSFDKIASIGMYEHVGRHRLGDYFKAVAGLMSPDALFLNAGIARPETTSDDDATRFLRKFVFPGGEVPYLSDAIRAAETAGLEVLDLENLRPHYAMTCASWLQRLQAHRDMCLLVVNSRVYRTWLLYLAGSAVAFECGEEGLYHMLLAKRRGTNARKLTRASMYSSIASPDGQEATRPLA